MRKPHAPSASLRPAEGSLLPDWLKADPGWIRRALQRSQSLPSGGWYVAGASSSFTEAPRCVRIQGKSWVIWRAGQKIYAAPDTCPHLGAALSSGCTKSGRLVCPWHGLSLGPEGHGAWRPIPGYDDGVLFWVRLAGEEPPTESPILCERPKRFVDAVLSLEARCEPRDVLQNRLDPWHGAHFHPHSFRRVQVIEQGEDEVTVRVAYRLLGSRSVEVDARFYCPEPRTIVMHIVAGEGKGSVVETHATPCAPGRTVITEAILASSEHPVFRVASRAKALLRPLLQMAAQRLWRDDVIYAERLYSLRHKED